MDDFRVSVKGFIVDDSHNLLVLKREGNDVHMPGIWEPPGGRLEIGENPFEGLKREIIEEIGIDVEVKEPLSVKHFTRQDGQRVTMIIFLCKPQSKEIKLSDEHKEFKWVNLGENDSYLGDFLGKDLFFFRDVDVYRRLFMK